MYFEFTTNFARALHKKGFVFKAFEEPVLSWDVLRFIILWYLVASQIFSIEDKQLAKSKPMRERKTYY